MHAIVFNLSHTLKRACGDLRGCEDDEDGKRGLAEIAIFSLLCRLMTLLKFAPEKEEDGTGKTFLDFCPHILEHMLPDKAGDSVLRALRYVLSSVQSTAIPEALRTG